MMRWAMYLARKGKGFDWESLKKETAWNSQALMGGFPNT
jgi:hypothetical protein